MEHTLIIAEKPELGKAVASALMGKSARSENGALTDGNNAVVYAYGHLLSLAEPAVCDPSLEDRYDEAKLPIFFDNWEKIPTPDYKDAKGKVLKDNSYVRTRLALIGNLLKQYPTVVNCGDPDDEGQLLIDEILDYYHYKGKVLRVLINDNLPENIRKQFQQLQDNKKFRSIGEAAYARQMADMAFGVNYSRLATIRSGTFLSLGRVQDPTLNLVVNRDRAIEAHETRKYYGLIVESVTDGKPVELYYQPGKELLEGEDHLYDRDVLLPIQQALTGKTVSGTVKVTEKRTAPPLPYNATELQADMNGRYGYSLSDTIAITQNLRDQYKAITYNRSDCQYLGEEHWKEAPKLLPRIQQNLGADFPVDTTIHSKCFDDSKISAHHGIIPQDVNVDFHTLPERERNVYRAIAERYLMQFLPPKVTEQSTAKIPVTKGVLLYRASSVKEKGFTEYFSSNNGKSKNPAKQPNPFLPSGEHTFQIRNILVAEQQTKPAPRYTPKTLVKDMCGISRYVTDPDVKAALKAKDEGKEGENGSIGTVATRGAIVDKLLERGYLVMKGKTIVSTEKGRALIDALPPGTKTADVTARWYLMQEAIKEGKADVNSIQHEVVREFQENRDGAFRNLHIQTSAADSPGACPVCGKPMRKGKSKKSGQTCWYCTGYKEGCAFRLFENTKRFTDTIHLTDKRVETLLKGGTISAELTNKAGKPYSAKLKLEVRDYQGKKYPSFVLDGFINHRKKKS